MIDLALAITFATAGQVLIARHDLRGLVGYGLAVLMLPPALHRLAPIQSADPSRTRATGRHTRLWRALLLLPASASAAVAVLAAADNTYRGTGVLAWLLAVGLFLLTFWSPDGRPSIWQRLGLDRRGWRLSWTALAFIGILLVGAYLRFWKLAQFPSEMTSDHIEKLLDVHDLVSGQRPIFFVRNTGREPWQFYWTLWLIRLFDLPTRFFALRLGTALVGMLTLPGVYLLGRDLFGRGVGLWATLFTAVASWPVILSRIGLRFPFAPAATAWSLFYLLRGLRDGRRNDFLMLGLWLGIGLHGYTAFRIMPLAVVVCWLVSWLAGRWAGSSSIAQPSTLARNAALTVLIAVIVFLPLGRFALEHPEDFWGRSASRMADPEHPPPDGPVVTLAKNLVNLAAMFHWLGDDVWVNTLSYAPVLDPILGALLVLGLITALWMAVRWGDLSAPLLVVAGCVLLLPSALSLAYPIENPSVVRAGGAIPAVMTIAALPVGLGTEHGWRTLRGWRRGALLLAALTLAAAVTGVNYQRYFGDYWEQYQQNAQNTTEIADAIRGFAASGGSLDDAWIVAWPYWIDTRGVGIELGIPPWNNVILSLDELDDHVDRPRPRLYVLHAADLSSLERLRALFPRGWTHLHRSKRPHRDFILFYVPPDPPAPSSPAGRVDRRQEAGDHAR